MADWNDLRTHIKNTYKIAAEEENFVRLNFETKDLRTQLVTVARSDKIGDSEWAEIATPVCRTSDIDPAVALERNFSFKLGFLGSFDGYVYFMHRVALLDMQQSEFDLPLELVAIWGDELEREFTGKDVL